jgi:preprotein translocase subunit SecB
MASPSISLWTQTSALPPSTFTPGLGQLVSARVSALHFETNERFDMARHQVMYETDTDRHVDLTLNGSTVEVEVKLEWEPVEPDTEVEYPFELHIAVTGEFEFPEDAPEDFRRGWTEFNGVYLLWPYVRSYVSALVAWSSLPPLILPTLSVPSPAPSIETGDLDLVKEEEGRQLFEEPDVRG